MKNKNKGKGNLSIESFKQEVKSFAKTSLFHVQIMPPKEMEESNDDELKEMAKKLESLKFTCEAARLPGFIFKVENRLISGLTSEMPVGFEHERLNLSFLCRGDMFERKFLDKWFMIIQDQNLRFNYYSQYVSPQIIVKTYNETGAPVYCVQYNNCYPNILTSQSLSWAETNALRISVDFSYETWEPLDKCEGDIEEVNVDNSNTEKKDSGNTGNESQQGFSRDFPGGFSGGPRI